MVLIVWNIFQDLLGMDEEVALKIESLLLEDQ